MVSMNLPGSYDCPHVGSIAVSVTVIGGDHTITCPQCASAAVERALDGGVDESCIVIKHANVSGHCDHEAEHRERWGQWADARGASIREGVI